MPWDQTTALKRIRKHADEAPDFEVQRFEDYWPIYEAQEEFRASHDKARTPPLFQLPKGKAVVVDTVQVYITITNYDEYRLEEGSETEASHDRAMRLLHLYYSAADRVIEQSAAQRVDFHNGRVHAVVIETGNEGVTQTTLAEAIALIDDFKNVLRSANQALANSTLNAEFRVGIDIGTCVAINNGSAGEQEPMFLGSAANHAAKLAAGGTPGVYVSDRVRRLLGYENAGISLETLELSDKEITESIVRRTKDSSFGSKTHETSSDLIVRDWHNEIKRGELPDFTTPTFKFFYKEPPLSSIDYSELQPSHSIRMSLVSLFADLSGYTDYIDKAVQSGGIRAAVRALFVIRQEFQNVVEKDFGGRKVRFIGDCIHAVLAEGTKAGTEDRNSVSTATLCAGGLHSSFALCKTVLEGLDALGLAIGMELGTTPISRIGIRGDRSVRIASSVATTLSEKMQQECEENGIKLGPKARLAAPAALEDLFNGAGYSPVRNYRDFAVCLSATALSSSSPLYARAHTPSTGDQPRAHLIVQ